VIFKRERERERGADGEESAARWELKKKRWEGRTGCCEQEEGEKDKGDGITVELMGGVFVSSRTLSLSSTTTSPSLPLSNLFVLAPAASLGALRRRRDKIGIIARAGPPDASTHESRRRLPASLCSSASLSICCGRCAATPATRGGAARLGLGRART
jgi:hypothetical protein